MSTAVPPSPFAVHKFGGTSVGSVDAILSVASIVEGAMCREADLKAAADGGAVAAAAPRLAIVVSAMGGKPKVTDLLLRTVSLGAAGDTAGYEGVLDAIHKRHVDTIRALLPEASWPRLEAVIEDGIRGLRDVLRAVVLMKADDERIRELVSGHGELWSAQIIAELMASRGHDFTFVDARKVLEVAHGPDGSRDVQWEASGARLQDLLGKTSPTGHLLITGFIASTPEGVMTTLGRDGSDYSASVFGRLLSASAITIWTDVSGVYSADPRKVPDARVVPHVTYNEAIELAFWGAKVLHPKTMAPAVLGGIPIYLRNTFEPEAAGTCISNHPGPQPSTVAGFSTVDNLALFNLVGDGLLGVVGTAARLFAALERASVQVVLIAQASSEHSICVAVHMKHAAAASAALADAFFRELHVGDVHPISYTAPVSVVAAVGDNMCKAKGTSGAFFGALGKATINVLAISQGSSERNISAVVGTPDATRALRAVHAAFHHSNQQLSVGIVAPPGFGGLRALMSHLANQTDTYSTRFHFDVSVKAIHDSTRMLLVEDGLGEDWEAVFATSAVPLDIDAFAAHVRQPHVPHWVLIDCNTYNIAQTGHYLDFMREGVHVVSCNAGGAAGSVDVYRGVRSIADSTRTHTAFMEESSVAAGLPVLRALDDVHLGGGTVARVQANMAWGVNTALAAVQASGGSVTFSDALAGAAADGLMEGGLREALSGAALARQTVVIGRRVGCPGMTLAAVTVDGLLPTTPHESKSDDVLEAVRATIDGMVAARAAAASAAGATLRYVAEVEDNCTGSVRLVDLDASHPLAKAHPADSCVVVQADCALRPMVLQGPPSTAATRAVALCGDLCQLMRRLGPSQGVVPA